MSGDVPLMSEPGAPKIARPDPPPLRIHHFMVCAAVTAVELSLLRFMLSRSPQQQSIGSGVFAITQVVSAVGLTLTGFSIYWWRKGYASFSQPGQMLLLQYAASFAIQLVSLLVVLVLLGPSRIAGNSNDLWLFSIVVGLGSLVFAVILPIAFYAWCAWKIADTWPWRVLFIFCALGGVVSSSIIVVFAQLFWNFSRSNIHIILSMPYLIRGAVLFPLGVLAAVTDFTSRRNRSWTHWTGLALWLLGQIGSVLTGVYYLYFWNGP
jgi:hypothetical protein